MPVRPFYPNDTQNNTGETVEDYVNGLPQREVFVKDTDGEMIGTGMILLPDGNLLAPKGFSVESGSIDFGDVITLSEASGFLGIKNNLYNQQYQIIDYRVPRNAQSDNPQIFKLNEAQWMFTPQPDDTQVLTSNPLIFNYTTALNARTNSITFRSSAAMSNVRIKITKSDVNVALKYLPSKSSWTLGTNGYSFVAGDNVIDFGDSPVPLQSGTMLTFEIRANTISLKGNSSGIPYFGVMTQRGEFVSLPLSTEVMPEAIKSKLESLASPNKLSKTAIQDGVLSVNAQFGDVNLDYEDVGAQQHNTKLDEISSLTLTPNTFVHVSSTGHFDLKPVTDAGLDWISQTNVDNQKSLLGLAAVASSGDYNDLSNKPTIPVINYPVTSVNTKTGAVVLNNTDVGAAATIHSHLISDVTGLQSVLDAKYNIPSGTTAQYIRGDGTLATFPTNISTFTNDSGYITQSGARSAISLTTTGSSGAATYNNTTGVLNIPNYNVTGGTVTSITAGTGLSGGTITTSGTISMPNVGTAGTYNSVTTDAQGRVTAGTTRSFTNPVRSLNTAFQPSATRDSYVSYSVDISCSAALLAGQSGTVVLEYANDSGFTTSVVTIQQATGSAGGVLNLATTTTASLTGLVPAGKFVRLRTINNTGTPTITFRTSQEVLL